MMLIIYICSLQEKLRFMALCKEKVLNFKATVMPKLSYCNIAMHNKLKKNNKHDLD